MANLKSMNIAIAVAVAESVKGLRKMESFKRANAEYVSLSRVLKDIAELWTLPDGTAGYSEVFSALGVNKDMLTPTLIHSCHPDLTTMDEKDGKTYETIHKPTWVYEEDKDGKPLMAKNDKGKWVRVKKLDKDGNAVRTLTTYLIKGWNPNTLVQYLSEDRTLRIMNFEAIIRKDKKNSKLTDAQIVLKATEMYNDYVAKKFAAHREPQKKTK